MGTFEDLALWLGQYAATIIMAILAMWGGIKYLDKRNSTLLLNLKDLNFSIITLATNGRFTKRTLGRQSGRTLTPSSYSRNKET